MGTKWISQGQGAKSHDVAQEWSGQLVRSRTQDSLGSIPDRVIRGSLEHAFNTALWTIKRVDRGHLIRLKRGGNCD